jgi:ankyrin repeat protein
MFIDKSWRRACAVAVAALWLEAAPCLLHAQALLDRFTMAVANDRADEVTAMLARGMDPNSVDANGEPALVSAARAGFEPTVDALLRGGAKVDVRNRFGDTPILVAAIGGHLAVVKKFVARGVDINAPGWTPLMYAATAGKDDVVRYLLGAGASVDAEGPNGITALMMAVRGGQADTVSLLLAKGANSNHRSDTGATALAWAQRGGFNVIEKELREHGAAR